MLDRITYRHAKRKQQHHAARIKHRAKDDIADGPPVLERAEDEDELRDDVDGNADKWPEEVDDEQADGFGEAESELLLEGCDGDEERDAEDG